MTCCSMWTKKKCSSPSASIGELSASTTSAMPGPEARLPPAGHRLAAPGERAACGAGRGAPTRSVGTSWSGSNVHGRREATGSPRAWKNRDVHLFHYHLVTSELRDVEARYLGKLGFELVARYGRIGDEHVAVEPGRLLGEARPGRVQAPAVRAGARRGQRRRPAGPLADPAGRPHRRRARRGRLPGRCSARATQWNLRVQEHGGRRTFVATNAGYRLEIHPPREWIDELLEAGGELRLAELQLRADEPATKAGALADLLGLEATRRRGAGRRTLVPFLAGGPEGRPELHGRAVRLSVPTGPRS